MGHKLYLAGLKLFDGDFLILITNEDPGNAKNIRSPLGNRNTFWLLETKVFNVEDTHITDHERIKLFVLLAVAICWSHKTGEWRHELRPIKIKTHGRPAISLFRYGLGESCSLV